MPLKSFERETTVGWSDAEKLAEITTYNRALLNKLEKLSREHPNTYKFIQDVEVDGVAEGKIYTCPKNLISFRAPTTRTMTDEQKQAAAKRLDKARQAKKKGKK